MPPSSHILQLTLGDMLPSSHVLQRILGDMPPPPHVLQRTLGDIPPSSHILQRTLADILLPPHILQRTLGGILPSSHILQRTLGGILPSSHIHQRTLADMRQSRQILHGTLGDMPRLEIGYCLFGLEHATFRKTGCYNRSTILLVIKHSVARQSTRFSWSKHRVGRHDAFSDCGSTLSPVRVLDPPASSIVSPVTMLYSPEV